MTDKILNWWRGLPWYWKIPAVLVLAIAVITCFVELFTGLFTKQPPDPWIEAAKRRQTQLERDQLRTRELIQETDRKYKAARDRFEKNQKGLEDDEKAIRDCDNVACVDDLLRKRNKSRD